MTFEENYFKNRNYTRKEELVKRHVLEVLRWASKVINVDLTNGAGKTALDVGCAFGYTSQALIELGYETCGFDISSWGTKQAKNKINSQFLVCDAQKNLPFVSGSFDLVVCFDVLEHLPCPEMALQRMFEVSKGVVVCTTPNKKVEKPIRKLTRDYDETHISAKSPTAWKECLANNLPGFSCVDAFHDVVVRLGGKLFFKSVRIPTYGLTVRIVIKK